MATTKSVKDFKPASKGSNSKAAVAAALAEALSANYVLYTKTQYYHWNVTGPHFFGLHTLFEEQYKELAAANDEIAERIRALGAFAPGTMKEFLANSKIKEDSKLPSSAQDMIRNLMKDHQAMVAISQHVQELADDADDEATDDMMVGRIALHEKAAWMLRAHLE